MTHIKTGIKQNREPVIQNQIGKSVSVPSPNKEAYYTEVLNCSWFSRFVMGLWISLFRFGKVTLTFMLALRCFV